MSAMHIHIRMHFASTGFVSVRDVSLPEGPLSQFPHAHMRAHATAPHLIPDSKEYVYTKSSRFLSKKLVSGVCSAWSVHGEDLVAFAC